MRRVAVVLLAVLAFGGCEFLERETPPVPTAAEAREFYTDHRGLTELRLSGNVVEIHVQQPYQQLRRGGSLWARVGPYIYLFSPSTQELMEAYPGVAAVRVVTHGPGGAEVARAMLLRETMNGLLWRRSHNLLGHALQEGTERPSRLEELARWGEQNTEFEYSPDYVRGRN